jgi:hypothetical protein
MAITFSPEALDEMMAMGPFLPYSPADDMMGPAIPADRLVYDSTSGGYTAAPPAEEEKVAPEVKSAVDTLLSLWGTSNSKGSHQYVLRDFSDAADSVPVDPSKDSDADRLKYAMQILEAGQNAKTQFSSKGLNRWKEAVAPLMSTYAPAQKFQWIGTTEDGGPDYGQWAQIASSVGFNGPTHIKQSAPLGYDENGNQTFSVGYGISPEFKAFVDKAHEQGYGFVQHADNIVNFNQRYGFRLPDGSIQGQYSVRDDQSVRDFGMSLLPIASMMLGVPGVGGALAQTIGSTVLPASAAAAASTAINTALASTGLSVSAAAVTSAVGQAAIQSGLSALGGGDAEDVIRAGITGLVGNAVAPAVNAAVPGSLGALEKVAERAITSATMSAISGQGDPEAAALGSLTSSLPGATGVPPALLQGALQLATTGTVTPSALINAATSLGRTSGTSQTGSSIGASYDDPSRTTDVVAELEDILGTPSGDGTLLAGPMDAMDFSAPNRAEQKTQVADYIRNQAANGVAGFKVGPGGVLEVEDRDRGITHRFTSDGSVLGSVDTVFGSRTGEFSPTSVGVKDFLSSPYVQSLFQGGEGSAGDAGRYMVSEVSEDKAGAGSLTQEQSDELLKQAEQDLMEEELYQVNPPVTLPPTDVDTAADSGQSVFDQIDQDLGQLALDRQEETRAEQDQEQARKDAEAAEYEQFRLQQEFEQQGQPAATEIVQAPAADVAQEVVQDQPSTESVALPPTTAAQEQVQEAAQTSVQPSTGVGLEQVRQIVSEALLVNPSLTEQQVLDIVTGVVDNLPAGLTSQDVAEVVDAAIGRLPQGPTTADIDSALSRAMADVATKSEVVDAIRNIQFPAGLSEADVSRVITDYMRQNPGLSPEDVATQVGEQLSRLPAYATPADVDALLRSGLSGYATSQDVAQLGQNLQTQVQDLNQDLQFAISDAVASGLRDDAALREGLDSLAGNLGTTRSELLNQLGTTEQALRSEFASQLGGVQTQVTELGADLSSAIESARAAGLQGDEALQAGLDTLANRLNTTTDQLLSQLGATEQGLRDQFAGQLGDVELSLTGQIGGLRQDVQEQYDMLTAAQQAEVGRRVQQGEDLTRAISDVSSVLSGEIAGVQAGLSGQIGGLRQEVAEQYEMLTDAQQAEVARRVQQGENLEAAIGSVASSLGERLTGVESGLTQQIGGVEERLNNRIEDLVDQGVDFQTATNQALKEVTGSIETLAEQQQQESERTQAAIGLVEERLGDRINQLMQQGLDWRDATDQAIAEVSGSVSSLAEETQSSISALGLDVESQIEEFRRAQEAADAAAAEAARQQAAEQRSATEAAVARAVQQSAQDAAAREAARQAAADDQSRRDRLMGLASSFIPQGTSGGVSDPYKATFLAPFIVGGKAPEKFEGALSGFLKEATTGDFLPDKLQQSTRFEEDQQVGADQYFGGPSASANPLDLYQPEQEYTGLFGFRAGGMVPFMAQGGTRYGHNAHGALNVLEHSGKHRVDYRQGDAVTGIGDGQSDDIPAMLADGEFVIPADVVAALGNGSTKAGSDKLYEMMHNIRRHHRSAGPKDLPPPAKAPLEYIKSRKGRSA